MLKRFLVSIITVMLIALTACSFQTEKIITSDQKSTDATDSSVDIQISESVENVNVTFDEATGKAIYTDDIISYSWDAEKYNYRTSRQWPSVYIDTAGLKFEFTVFNITDSVPSDMNAYLISCGKDFFNENISGYVSADHPQGVNTNGYKYSICTIHYGNKDANKSDTEIVRIYALTNDELTAALGVTVTGEHSTLEQLYSDNYAGNKDNGLIEKEVKAIIDSFEFVKR